MIKGPLPSRGLYYIRSYKSDIFCVSVLCVCGVKGNGNESR